MDKDIKLVNVTDYAKHYKIDRKTVYSLIKEGRIVRYRGLSNEPLLDIKQRPSGVKKLKGYRKRKIK